MNDRPRQVSSLDARDDLLAIADAWPDLLARLGRDGNRAPDGMPKPASRTTGLVINEYVSQVMADVGSWVSFLARVLIEETDWTPTNTHTPAMLADIARTRIGHFTAHADEGMRLSFMDDAKAMRATVTRAAYPDGYRTLDTRIPCEEHETTVEGARAQCPGTYTVRPTRTGAQPDLVCSHDRSHRIPPSEWSRGRWRVGHAGAAEALVRAITGAS